MKELLEILARALVDNPDAVQVNQEEKENAIVLELRVAAEDMGKVIGKQGRVARAIRTVVRSAGGKLGKRVVVEIVQ
ncbi:MAG: KH domain-containing protein [Clostridia bacterium]|nr:MAG: KH domain-containing protein [Clostridia bacterium]